MDIEPLLRFRYIVFNQGQFIYAPTATGPIVNQTLYIPYAAPLAVVSRMVALGIVDIGYRITDPYFQMKIFNAYIGTTGFWINVTTNELSYFGSGIRMKYLSVDGTFTHPFSSTYFTSVDL